MEELYGEFSFNGHRCTEFGLHYIPSSSNRLYSSPSWKTADTTVTGRHGGYYYGSTVNVREFSLECYFEDASIERLEAIQRWLHRSAEGKLIFDDRPYVYYMVRPSDPTKGDVWATAYADSISMLGSGRCTLYFKAYQPFGVLTDLSYGVYDENGMRRHTGMLQTSKMPLDPAPAAGDFLLYNPGTEKTRPTFQFSGSAPNGLKIINNTTGETCSLEPFDMAENYYLTVNGEYGSVTVEPAHTYAFEYHTDGYVSLDPCTPYIRDAFITYSKGSNVIGVYNVTGFDSSYNGSYVYLQQKWYRIIYVRDDGVTAILNESMTESGSEQSDIVRMNELTLEGEGLALTDFKVEYKAYVR